MANILQESEQGVIINPPTPKKTIKPIILIFGGIIAVISLWIFFTSILTVTFRLITMDDITSVESVLDSFMKSMQAKDTDSAYTFFSARSKLQTPLSDLEKACKSNNQLLFEGYEHLRNKTFKLSFQMSSDSGKPHVIANYKGEITYKNGSTGRFEALLEKNDGEWKIFNISFLDPPKKLHKKIPYLKTLFQEKDWIRFLAFFRPIQPHSTSHCVFNTILTTTPR